MNGQKYPRTFEIIDRKEDWERLRVPNGWIVHHSTRYILNATHEVVSECSVFVPDKDGEWILE